MPDVDGTGDALSASNAESGSWIGVIVAAASIVLLALLLVVSSYVVVRFGASKFSLWCRYHASHSMPGVRLLYVPKEGRDAWAEALYGRRRGAGPTHL